MANAGESLGGDLLFDSQYLRWLEEQLEESVQKVILDMNFITGNRYLSLMDSFEKVKASVRNAMESKPNIPDTPFVLPFEQIDLDFSEAAGEKMARLGEIGRKLKFNTPDGFIITARACRIFFDRINLSRFIPDLVRDLEEGRLNPKQAEVKLAGLIMETPLPRDVIGDIRKAALSIDKDPGKPCLFALRSSAVGEDGDLSYAGLHETFLGVKGSDLPRFYKRVLASLFSARAVAYRFAHGESLESALMAAGCLRMIDSAAAGVVYTLDPNEPEKDRMIISAAPGLGKTVVEGLGNADRFLVSRTPPHGVNSQEVHEKKEMYEISPAGGIRLAPVPPDRQHAPAISNHSLAELAGMALRIEHYMKVAQDIEWAQGKDGRLVILQARPLQIRTDVKKMTREAREALRRFHVLISNRGTIGCRGIGHGPIVVVTGEETSKDMTENAVLVAHQSSPHLAELVPGASAVITDTGASTGHLATITREFHVPSIFDVGVATQVLKDGMEVTVDAEEKVIYQGKVDELLRYQVLRNSSFQEIREFRMLRKMLRTIAPLHLSNPRAKEFSPRHCRSYHDIIRFAHEKAVEYLSNGHILSPSRENVYCKSVDLNVPLDLTLIDIGGGLVPPKKSAKFALQDITCAPLRAFLQGMSSPGAWSTEPADMDLRSFMSSAMGPSVTASAKAEHNLAVISQEYMNLSLHLGFHINQIDAYISDSRNDNYIYFRFEGGMTDITRRSRRARMISIILEKLDFMVEVKGDFVVARLKKFEKRTMIDKMTIIGHLVGFTRQMDVHLREDPLVDKGVAEFMETTYTGRKLQSEEGM